MYHNSSIVVTQDPRFQLLAFASGQSETPVLVKRDEEIEAITRANFRPPMRRRDGQGVLLESTVFAGYKVAYNDEEMLAIVATVRLNHVTLHGSGDRGVWRTLCP